MRDQNFRTMRLSALLCILFAGVTSGFHLEKDNSRPHMIVDGGLLRGTKTRSRCGRDIFAYKGIPYARPPVGELRFKAPVKAEKWEGVLDASKDGPVCIQKNYVYADPKVVGQEDCLYMNVYTPLSLNTIPKKPLAVMVYFHGGGWFYGNGGSGEQGPEYLLDYDIVLVTMNYRLGALGFLSTGDDLAPGNWALKDQVMVLQWVQDNIHRFGGDADSVTIFGQSAGAASVHYLMFSPLAKGLFHRAVCQSGSSINLWATPLNSMDFAKLQATFVNCTVATPAEMLECLRTVDAKTLVDSGDKFKFWYVDPLAIYRPTIEVQSANNPSPFFIDHPANLLKKGDFIQVPLIMGVMGHEGILRGGSIVVESRQRDDFNAKWDILGPQVFGLQLSTTQENIPQLWKNISSFYMAENNINISDPTSIRNFINMYGDRSFIYSIYQTILYHSLISESRTYFYKFDYEGQQSYSRLFLNSKEKIDYNFTTSHCDDLIYEFPIPALGFVPISDTSQDIKMSRVWLELLTNFAIEGIPHTLWEPVTQNKLHYLHIEGPVVRNDTNVQLTMKDNFLDDRMKFWKNLNLFENK